MIEVKEELLENNLIRHYAIDNNGKQYKILQVETNIVYDEAIDVMPCRFTYKATSEEIQIEQEWCSLWNCAFSLDNGKPFICNILFQIICLALEYQEKNIKIGWNAY